MAFVFATAVTAGLVFIVQLDTTPPWPVEKEYPDLGPIHNSGVIVDTFPIEFDTRFHESIRYPHLIHPGLTNSKRD
jgi:hypothetical protein